MGPKTDVKALTRRGGRNILHPIWGLKCPTPRTITNLFLTDYHLKLTLTNEFITHLVLPKMAKRPQAAHITKDNPTEPERSNTPPGLMKIPDPYSKI